MRSSDWSSDVCSSDLSRPKRWAPLWAPPPPPSRSARQLLIRRRVRARRIVAEAADLVLFIGFEISFEPFDMAIALERQDVRREAIEEEAVVADDHGAAREIFERFRSEEHTSELQSLMRISYAVFCLKKKKKHTHHTD